MLIALSYMSLYSPLDEVHLSSLVKAQLKSLMEQSSAEVVVAASAAGDISTIRTFLQDRPTEVRDGLNTYNVLCLLPMNGIRDTV